MASTNHTPNLNLNQWAANDEVKRQDFNDDNAKIDAAVAAANTALNSAVTSLNTAIAAKPDLVFGNYAGNRATTRVISLGFTPKAVLIICQSYGMVYNNSKIYGGLFGPNYPLKTPYADFNAAEVVTGGFQVTYSSNPGASTNDSYSYNYIAVK